MIYKCILFSTSLFLSFGAFAQSIETDIRKQINKILAHDVDIDPEETPGLLIGIIEVDTFFILEYGNRADGKSDIQKEDVFDIGGLSKVFVSPIACSLVLDGTFKYADKLEDDYPEWKDTDLGKISFEDLLKHESGIKKVLIGLENKSENGTVLEANFKRALEDNPIDQKRNFQYSHHNYALLSMWMEKRTNLSFPQLLNNFISSQEKVKNPNLAHGEFKYMDEFTGLTKGGKQENAMNYGSHEYSQGMQAKMVDLIQFTRSFWLDENNEVAQECLDNHTETKIRKKLRFSRSFYVLPSKKYTIYTHSGRSNRHTAAIHFVPETKTGIIALSNSEIGTKDLSLLVLRMINHNWKRKPHGQEK